MRRSRLLWQLFPTYVAVALLSLAALGWHASQAIRGFHYRQSLLQNLGEAQLAGRPGAPGGGKGSRPSLRRGETVPWGHARRGFGELWAPPRWAELAEARFEAEQRRVQQTSLRNCSAAMTSSPKDRCAATLAAPRTRTCRPPWLSCRCE